VRKIAIYGKGGSGKSTVSAALSVVLARRGLKVLHVGCDPKADSTLTLTSGKRIPTLLDLLAAGDRRPAPERFVFRGRHGIDCVEAGGPRPGAGCGGRGVARMFELFQEVDLLGSRPYDVVLFDVLGDVVCGGFAAPLRLGFADLAFIVVSEEPLSLYAANNIIHAIRSYSANGVRLGGFILNVSDDRGGEGLVRSVAERVGTRVVGVIPRDREIQFAERRNLTAAELEPSSPTVQALEQLADAVLSVQDPSEQQLSPMPAEELFGLLSAEAVPRPAPEGEGGAGPAEAPETHRVSKAVDPIEVGLQGRSARILPPERSVAASGVTRKAFARLLVLERDPMARLMFDVTSVEARRGILFVRLESPSAGLLELQLSASSPKAYARVRDISVSYSEPLPRNGRKIVDYCVARLERTNVVFSDLCRCIEEDPGSTLLPSLEESRDRRVRQAVPQARHWNLWDEDSMSGVFFFPQERRRQVLAEIHLTDPAVLLQHGTQACGVSEQGTTEYATHFVRYPWKEDRSGRESRTGTLYYLTDIREHELILGSNDALEGALRKVHDAHPDHAVVIEVSCTPVISGEDWAGTVARFRKNHEPPVLATAMAGDDLVLELARAGSAVLDGEAASGAGSAVLDGEAASGTGSAVLDGEAAGGTGRRTSPASVRRVHLVGFPRIRAVDELCRLLADCGVEVAGRMVPDVSLRALASYSDEASAQLLWPQAEYEPLYGGLLLKSRVPAVRITPPFGLAGTRAFLEQAARSVGLTTEAAPAAVLAAFSEGEARLAALRERAASMRLGIAVTPHFSSVPGTAEQACGVPLVDFLGSLGFQVELLHDAQDRARLDWWLRSGLHAVYTELSFDPRLADAGVAPFGLADLEPGIEGAVRTARRLIRLADARFFSDSAIRGRPA